MVEALAGYPITILIPLVFLPMLLPILYWVAWFGRAKRERPITLRHFQRAFFRFGILGAGSGLLPVVLFAFLLLGSPPAGYEPSATLFRLELPLGAVLLASLLGLFWMVRFVAHALVLLFTEEEVAARRG